MQNPIGDHEVCVSQTFWPRRKRPAIAATDSERREAYIRLLEAQEAHLLRFALRLARNRLEDAQDLTQETLVRGYQAFTAGRFQEGTNARAWLMRILMNVFLNENRRRKWNADADLDSLIQNGAISPEALRAAPADRPDTALLMRIFEEPLALALDALTEELRVCTLLVEVEEYTYAEAAAILEIPVGTVRSRLWRARRLLLAALNANRDFTKG